MSRPRMGRIVTHGIFGSFSTVLILTGTKVIASGGDDCVAVSINNGASVSMTDVTAKAMNGATNIGVRGGGIIDRCSIEGTYGVVGSYSTLRIGASKIVGLIQGSGSCVASYDGNYTPIGANCQ